VLFFPDGRLRARRWRPVAALAVVMLALLVLGRAFGPTFYDWPRRNPLALPWGVGKALAGIQGLGLLLMFPVSTLSAPSLAGRARGERGELAPVLRLAAATAILMALAYFG